MTRHAQKILRGLIAAALCLAANFAHAQDPNLTRAEKLKRHIVAIFDQDGKLLGSGASVSATGLIVTSKHILEQRIAGSRARNYHMSVEVRAQRDAATRPAQLVATHPHLDIAILNAPDGDLIQPLFLGAPDPQADTVWFAIGHPRGVDANSQRYFETKSGDWSSVELRSGHYVLPPGFDTGMSGGPLIIDDRVVGIVSHAGQKTYIVPVHAALTFFDLVGFPTSETGAMRQEDHVGQLAGKVQKYERILSDIQIDRRWTCTLDADWNNGPAKLPTKLALKVSHDKRLASQPDMNARLEMAFDADVFLPGEPLRNVRGEPDVEWVTEQGSVSEFDSILNNLTYQMGRMQLDTQRMGLRHLNLRIKVSHISGSDFIKQDPGAYEVCCRLPHRRPGPGQTPRFDLPVEAKICPPADPVLAEGQSNDSSD